MSTTPRTPPDPMQKAICGARKRNGQPCPTAPMLNGRCRMHGGKSLAGPASPSFRHGRYSKFLPSRLAAKYQEALADPDLLALREEVAVVDARLADLLSRADSGESGERWTAAQRALATYQKELRGHDQLRQADALAALTTTISAGVADHAAWAEIARLLDQRARLVEGERKRLEAAQQTMTATEAMTLLAAVTEVIRTHVADPQTLSAIARDIGGILARNALPAARPG